MNNPDPDKPFDFFSKLPRLPRPETDHFIDSPNDEECFALWQKYGMLGNVRKHSLLVANIATALAKRAVDMGSGIDVTAVRASALLHDIAKTYCLQYGGSHATLGASWTSYETKNALVAQGVMLHVHWPWPLPGGNGICILPIFVLYADKRVRHDECVSLEDRFKDLVERYGTTPEARENIRESHRQTLEIEKSLSKQLEWNLDEITFDCWRLVK